MNLLSKKDKKDLENYYIELIKVQLKIPDVKSVDHTFSRFEINGYWIEKIQYSNIGAYVDIVNTGTKDFAFCYELRFNDIPSVQFHYYLYHLIRKCLIEDFFKDKYTLKLIKRDKNNPPKDTTNPCYYSGKTWRINVITDNK